MKPAIIVLAPCALGAGCRADPKDTRPTRTDYNADPQGDCKKPAELFYVTAISEITCLLAAVLTMSAVMILLARRGEA